MGMEYEWKYEAPSEVRQQIQAAYPVSWQTVAMETTYYDTPDSLLSQRKCTLRRRLENGRSICTLKTPGIGAARGEWELECDDIGIAFPELCKLSGDPELRLSDSTLLIPVCGARFTRQCATVDLGDAQVELALDEGILFSGKHQRPLGELEVELKSGDVAAAHTFALLLAKSYALRPEPLSKFARANALMKEK